MVTEKAIQRPRTFFDSCVRGAICLHVVGDVIALWVAYNAAMLWHYAAIRVLEIPLMLLMILIYTKARRC